MGDDNSSSEDSEKRYAALPALKSRRKNAVLLKHRRQKFCAKWTSIFPWLRSDNVDESIGFCTVCDKRLVCKKSHLERHESSFKHQRASGDGIIQRCDSESASGDDTQHSTVPEFLECGKQEPNGEENEFDHAIEIDPDYSLEYEMDASKQVKKETSRQSKGSTDTQSKSISCAKSRNKAKLNRIKLLKRIDRDRQELNEYYYARQKQNSPTPSPSQQQQQKHQDQKYNTMHSRDSFDLFFESVSASVKTFPPKLAAEVKIRVSQIVAEYELRAICEREALEHSANVLDDTSMIVASTTSQDDANDVELSTPQTTVTTVSGAQILYTFQPKLRE